ncbi:SRPBCC domain-containing protein [soil metagenome]
MKTQRDIRLEIKRFINAPRDRVYTAWTDPARLKEWFGPEDVQTLNFTADVRVGGRYRWDLISPDGEEMTAFGEYRELIPGRKIVFTWKWDDDENWTAHDSVVTVELTDHDSGTDVRLTHVQLPSKESRDRHSEGWNSLLDKLEKFVGE